MTDKKFEDYKIEFAPGCFDQFEGTQEELDGLVAEIKRMFASGEAQAMARPLDLDALTDEDIEMLEHFDDQESKGRTLQ